MGGWSTRDLADGAWEPAEQCIGATPELLDGRIQRGTVKQICVIRDICDQWGVVPRLPFSSPSPAASGPSCHPLGVAAPAAHA